MFDARTKDTQDENAQIQAAIDIKNDCTVNTLYVYVNGNFIMSGDQKGQIKVWDIRKTATNCHIDTKLNSETASPISFLAVSHPEQLGDNNTEEGKYLAVNSYDNGN